jgi:hypothetical protein
MSDFETTISAAYATAGAAIDLGRAVHDGELVRSAAVRVPQATMNRHIDVNSSKVRNAAKSPGRSDRPAKAAVPTPRATAQRTDAAPDTTCDALTSLSEVKASQIHDSAESPRRSDPP